MNHPLTWYLGLFASVWVMVALAMFMFRSFINSYKTGKVPHRCYLLEKNKKREFSTVKDHPFEYYFTLGIPLPDEGLDL